MCVVFVVVVVLVIVVVVALLLICWVLRCLTICQVPKKFAQGQFHQFLLHSLC